MILETNLFAIFAAVFAFFYGGISFRICLNPFASRDARGNFFIGMPFCDRLMFPMDALLDGMPNFPSVFNMTQKSFVPMPGLSHWYMLAKQKVIGSF